MADVARIGKIVRFQHHKIVGRPVRSRAAVFYVSIYFRTSRHAFAAVFGAASWMSGSRAAQSTRSSLVMMVREPSLRAFVRILAEGWVFLTGEMPGKHPDPSKNPFLRVVEAAWIDWHQVNNSDALAFGEALNAAISSIDEAQLNRLRAVGPGWVRLPGRV